jgi:hypothetical protein
VDDLEHLLEFSKDPFLKITPITKDELQKRILEERLALKMAQDKKDLKG